MTMRLMKLENILLAYELYKELGFIEIRTPWVCDSIYSSTIELTVPGNDQDRIVKLSNGDLLLGSSEQGFLIKEAYGMGLKLNEDKKYMSFSPCFRIEDTEVNYVEEFWKLELHVPHTVCTSRLFYDAQNVFKKICVFHRISNPDLDFELYENGMDILLNGIEIGSYGSRKVEFTNGDTYTYTYGTAIAEPRFTQALNHY